MNARLPDGCYAMFERVGGDFSPAGMAVDRPLFVPGPPPGPEFDPDAFDDPPPTEYVAISEAAWLRGRPTRS